MNCGICVTKLEQAVKSFIPIYMLESRVSMHVLLRLTGSDVPSAPRSHIHLFFVLFTSRVIQSAAEVTNYELLHGVPTTI